MSLIKKLNEEIVMWDKMEGAGAVFWMYGWGKKKQKDPEASDDSSMNEDKDDDYRDNTQGNRNAKYLKKARIYANTPQARLKRERTELKKELNGES